MRYCEIINEGFFDGFKGSNGIVEVYKNPSKAEFLAVKNDHANGGVRGFLDGTDLYIWDAYLATHGEVDEALGLWGQRFDWQDRLVVYWNWDYEDDAYPDGFQDFEKVREWIKSLPSCRRLVTDYEIVRG